MAVCNYSASIDSFVCYPMAVGAPKGARFIKMKTILTILTIVFTMLLSSPSHTKWTKVDSNGSGDNYYVDFDRVRKQDGYVYYWMLADYLKPDKNGIFSGKAYWQGDCKLFRYKQLSWSFHTEKMGGGTADSETPETPKWEYVRPASLAGFILKLVCKHKKRMPIT